MSEKPPLRPEEARRILRDSADAVDEYHEHEYTRASGKQAPAVLDFSSPNEAMAAAIRKAKAEAPGIVRQWQES